MTTKEKLMERVESLLKDLKRSNQARKLKLANKAGFKTVQEYYKYLTGKDMPVRRSGVRVASYTVKLDATKDVIPVKLKVEAKTKPTIHNVIILDASGSMSGAKYNNSIIGITNELNYLKQDNTANWTSTIVEFVQRGRIITHCFLDKVGKDFKGTGATGSDTPLFKTIIDTLDNLQKRVHGKDKVLVKIYTDGVDNASEHYDEIICSRAIKKAQLNNITVTFVGVKGDLERLVRRLELDQSNTLEITNDGKGFKEAFDKSLVATANYATNVAQGKDVSRGFYKY